MDFAAIGIAVIGYYYFGLWPLIPIMFSGPPLTASSSEHLLIFLGHSVVYFASLLAFLFISRRWIDFWMWAGRWRVPKQCFLLVICLPPGFGLILGLLTFTGIWHGLDNILLQALIGGIFLAANSIGSPLFSVGNLIR